MRPDGALTLDVRLVLRADDGALIALRYQALRHGPGDVLARIDRGEAIDPATYYFRSIAQFETAAPQYDWLNRIFAVGIGHRLPDARPTACLKCSRQAPHGNPTPGDCQLFPPRRRSARSRNQGDA